MHCTLFMVKNGLREVGDWFTRRGQCQQPGAAKGRFEVLSTWSNTGRLPLRGRVTEVIRGRFQGLREHGVALAGFPLSIWRSTGRPGRQAWGNLRSDVTGCLRKGKIQIKLAKLELGESI